MNEFWSTSTSCNTRNSDLRIVGKQNLNSANAKMQKSGIMNIRILNTL